MTALPLLPAAPVSAPGRAIMRNVTGGTIPGVEIQFDARTAFDFVYSLDSDAGSTDDLPATDRKWLLEERAKLPAHLTDLPHGAGAIFAATFLVDHPEITEAEHLVEHVRSLPGRALAQAVLADDLRRADCQPLMHSALEGTEDAIVEVVASWPAEKRAFLERLLRAPDDAIADLGDLLAAWLPSYKAIEGRIDAILKRDVELRHKDRETLGPVELIEATTNGIRWLSEPGVRRVILAPSYFTRPFNFVFAAEDWRMFGYPVADAALDADDPLAPPAAVVRLHRALGDESRLRILRLLRDRDWYLSEIAERLSLSKPTIKHHLAQLRAAGLVTLIEEGGLSYYSLRRDRLDDASGDLKRYLT
jgi:DNA-binding transcriptional ArsR family regulator